MNGRRITSFLGELIYKFDKSSLYSPIPSFHVFVTGSTEANLFIRSLQNNSNCLLDVGEICMFKTNIVLEAIITL